MTDTDEPRLQHRSAGRRPFLRAGRDPDPRFSLANERTFLAWTRTSLALLATGLSLHLVAVPVREPAKTIAAAMFVLLGLIACVAGALGWIRTERALRLDRGLPRNVAIALIPAGTLIAVLTATLGSL